MAITPLTVTIDLNPSYKKIPAVYVSQLDNNLRELAITVQDGGVNYDVASSGYDVYIEGTKPDYKGFSYEVTEIGGTIVGSVITVPMQTQMTCVKGMVSTEIVLKSGSDRIGSANFLLVVERAGLDEDTDVSETDIPGYIDGAQRAAEAAEDAKDLAVAAKDTAVAVAASIPEDYTTLSNDVDDLKSAFQHLNIFDKTKIVNNTGYKTGTGNAELGQRQASSGNYVSTSIEVKPSTTYHIRQVVNGVLTLPTTGCRFVEFNSSGTSTAVTWLSNAGYDITTASTTYSVAFQTSMTVSPAASLIMYEDGVDPAIYYDNDKISSNRWEQRIYALETYDRFAKNKCHLLENSGKKFDVYGNSVAEANCTIQPSGITKFSEKSAKVIFNSTGAQRLKINVSAATWESITLVMYVSDQVSWASDKGIRLRFGFNTQGTINLTYWYPANSLGWIYLKLPKTVFSNPPAFITSLYVYAEAGSSVPASTDYQCIYFDSVIFDQRIKPTVIINFDHWWQKSVDNGAYQYAFDRGIPFTLMTKGYDSLDASFITLAKKASLLYGCENGYYAGYGSSNTTFISLASYTDGINCAEQSKADFYNALPCEKLVSFGASTMKVNSLAEKALKNSGFGLVRALSLGHPYGYFDKETQVISSIGVSYSDVSSIDTLKSYIDDLITYGSMALYFTHGICNDDETQVGSGSAMRLSTWKTFVDYLVTKRDAGELQIITMRDLYNSL